MRDAPEFNATRGTAAKASGAVPDTVHVVDDDPSVLKAVGRLLRSAGFDVAGYPSAEALLSAEAFADARDRPPAGCLVLDVTMPGMSGPQAYERLARSGADLPVVFLTGDGDLPTGIRAMKAGAVDYLSKPCPDEALLDAVRRALAAARHRRAKREEDRVVRERFAALTPREHDVMLGVVAGHPNKRIGTDLGMVEATVKIHRGRVMAKLGVASLADLVRLYERSKAAEDGR